MRQRVSPPAIMSSRAALGYNEYFRADRTVVSSRPANQGGTLNKDRQ